MRRHHATAAAGIALRKIFEPEFPRRHSTTEHKSTIAIVRNDVIVRFHLHGNGCERFVSHPGNVKMTFALTIQILLAQVGVTTFEHDGEESKLVLFSQSGHRMIQCC